MGVLGSVYLALGIFGLGVTVVDLFGLLGHHDSGGHDAGGHGDGHDAAQDSAHDAAGHEMAAHDVHGDDSHDAHHDTGHDDHAAHHPAATERGSILGAVNAKARVIGRLIYGLRIAVSFSLGAGLTGTVAVLGGIGSVQSLFWSAAGGVLTTAITRLVRRVARRDLDSSLSTADFIMAEAEISVPVEPGKMGKARVRKFGLDREVYVMCREAGAALAAGTRVRIVDFDQECYFVECI